MKATMDILARLDDGLGPATPGSGRGADRARAAAPGGNAWRLYAGVWAAVVVALLLVFNRDVAHLARTWWNNATYGHCLLIAPIIGWLIWQRRDGLRELAPAPWLPGAFLMLGAGLVWLVGEFMGAAVLRHAGIVLLVMASVPAILGRTITRACAFPLFFALFMIPVGEQIEPQLQTVTAEFATWLLRALGVPTHMDGVFISIPNGDFEVAKACSGVRFLIAMVAFGALVSNVCFLSWKRRLAFMAASFILPVVANGIRVWGTIHVAYVTTPEVARGVDHVVYGWVFFAVVMAALLAIGWRFFDRPVDDPFVRPERLQAPGTPAAPARQLLRAAALAFALGAAAPAWAALAQARGPDRPTAAIVLAPPPGWERTAFQGLPWRPLYDNATARTSASFVDAAGQPVELFVAVYDRQYEGHEVVGYGNGLVDIFTEDSTWSWAATQAPLPGASVVQLNHRGAVREVVQYYLVNGRLVGSPYAAKVEGLKARLFGGDPQAATIIVAAERRDPLVTARPALERFIAAMGPADRVVRQAIRTN